MKASPVKKSKRNPPSAPTTRMSLRSSTRSASASSPSPSIPAELPPHTSPINKSTKQKAATMSSSQQQQAEDSEMDEYDVDSCAEFEYSSSGDAGEVMSVSEVDDRAPASPVTPESPQRARGSSRQLYNADVTALIERFGSQHAGMRKTEEGTVSFKLHVPGSGSSGVRLVLLTPELAGYPHVQHFASSEDDVDDVTENILGEVFELAESSDRSVAGVVNYLVARLVRGEPAPQRPTQDSDEEFDEDEEIYGLGEATAAAVSGAFKANLQKDFVQILEAGYRPGYSRISALENVWVVSVRVDKLGVPVRALEAWDSAALLRGSVVYLVLLANFGSGYPANLDDMTHGQVSFKIGLSPKPKPSKKAIATAFRKQSGVSPYTANEFESFALSAPLDALFNQKYAEIFSTRRKENVSWAVSEDFCLAVERPSKIDKNKAAKINQAELNFLAKEPKDPMASASQSTYNNYALIAFTFLIRRFTQNPRFCLVCYRAIESEVAGGALRAFVCSSQLCLFQCINMNFGASLEHEVCHNTAAVDLLVSLAYSAAAEDGLRPEQQPVGLGLEVPSMASAIDGDETRELVDFDKLPSSHEKNRAIKDLISTLPKIAEMKAHLEGANQSVEEKLMHRVCKLSDMLAPANRATPEAPRTKCSPFAWRLLRWIVASNTSYLKLVEEEDELVQGVDASTYRQFRFIVGSAEKEHKFKIEQAKKSNGSVQLHAFHGSPVKNWHSILRAGLDHATVAHGRAYGNGVYFALQGDISLGSYAAPATTSWKNAEFTVGSAAAIAEIVNSPGDFVSSSPYLVVAQVDWIQCRYLLVRRGSAYGSYASYDDGTGAPTTATAATAVPTIAQNSKFPLTLAAKSVKIPDVLPKLEKRSKLTATAEDLSPSDDEIMKQPIQQPKSIVSAIKRKLTPKSSKTAAAEEAHEKFEPVEDDILSMVKLLPPPRKPNAGALTMVSKELKAILAEQEKEGPIKAGHYLDFDRSHDNLFTWIVEIPRASFDQSLPLVKDMVAKKVTSILMEIRFGESFPLAPPFFRIVYPRLLSFAQGGGGHITAGGSVCMDLLTPDGWSPAYTIPAVLLQIRMAMSNLEPKPARIDTSSWNQPYNMSEAIEGFRRAAAAHGWQVPDDLNKLRY